MKRIYMEVWTAKTDKTLIVHLTDNDVECLISALLDVKTGKFHTSGLDIVRGHITVTKGKEKIRRELH